MEYATYDYDVNGIRTRKELNESGYIYYTQNGKLMREVGQFDGVTKRQVIDFIYDEYDDLVCDRRRWLPRKELL